MPDKSKDISINGFEFENFPVKNYIVEARAINGLIECLYDRDILENDEDGFYRENTTYWMKQNGSTLGIVRFVSTDSLSEILRVDHAALDLNQINAVIQFTKYKNRYLDRISAYQYCNYLVPDVNGLYYHHCRLPDGLTLDELDLTKVKSPSLFQFPRNLTVNQSVTSNGVFKNVGSTRIPDGLTVHVDLELTDVFPINSIGNNVNIFGKLTIHAPNGLMYQNVGNAWAESLYVLCDSRTASIVKLPLIAGDATIRASGAVVNIQCGGNLTIDGSGRGDRMAKIHNIQCGKSLSIVDHRAESISNIKCQDLIVDDCLASSIDISFIPGNLTIENCLNLTFTAKHIVCGGDLTYLDSSALPYA